MAARVHVKLSYRGGLYLEVSVFDSYKHSSSLRGDGGRLGTVQGAESRGPLGSIPPSAGGVLRSGGCSEETSSRLHLSTPEPCERWREGWRERKGRREGWREREGGFA